MHENGIYIDYDIEKSLVRSSAMLLAGQTNRRLLDALTREFGVLDKAYVIDWIPEQTEHIYTIAVPPNTVVLVEVPLSDDGTQEVLLERSTFEEYRRSSGKATKAIKIRVAAIDKLMKKIN